MKKIPAVSVLDGVPVLADNDTYSPLPLSLAEVFNHLDKKYDEIYVLDVNGIERGTPQFEVIEKIREILYAKFWLDGGARTAAEACDFFMLGADVVVITTKRICSFLEVKKLAEMSEEFVFSIDYYNGEIVGGPEFVDLGLEQAITVAAKHDVRSVMLTFLDNKYDEAVVRKGLELCETLGLQLYLACDSCNLAINKIAAQIVGVREVL